MKKILNIIGAMTIVAFASSAVIASPVSEDNSVNSNSDSTSGADSYSSTTQGQQQGQLGVGVDDGDGNGFGNNNSTSTYKESDIPVATAYAPALTTSNDTCMGSTSVGGQGLLLGVSFGTTWTDNDCITRKDARFVHNAGHRTVALSLMCGKEAVRAAVARAGTPEQIAACAITTDEVEEYRTRPVIVQVRRTAPDHDDQFDNE